MNESTEKVGTEVKFLKCDTFNPEEIGVKIGEILGALDPDDDPHGEDEQVECSPVEVMSD